MTKELKSQQEREININGNEIITKFRQIIKGIFDREGTFTDEDINTLKSILNSENLSEGERESLEKELLDHLEAHLDKLRITNPLEIPGNNISTVKANSFLPRKNDTDDPQEREREFSVLERPINMRVPPIFIDAVRKILEKYYKAFISLLNNNGINIGTIITRETGREINDIPLPVQIDMVAFNQTCLEFIEYLEHVLEQIYEGQSNSNEKKIDFITRLVSRFIFEIENSLAMYNLMDRITNGWFVREMQIYLSGFKRPNSSQDDIPREIAVGSSTETKYLNMLSGEWGWQGRDPNITGFDRLMSPLELSNYIIGIMSGEIKPNTYVYLRSSLPTEVIKAREYLGCSTEKMLGELIAILRESEYYRNARDRGETDEAIVEHFIRTLESVTMTPNTRAEINDTKEYFQHMDENIAVFIDNENVGEILKLLLLELTRDEQISGILENIASIEEKYFSNESNETKETDPNQDPEKRKKQSIDKAKKRTAIMKYLIFSVALGEYRYDANGLLFVGEEQIGLPIPENKIDEIYEKITEPISPETEGQISRQRITRLHYIKTLVDRKEEETIRNLLDAHFNGLDLATETIIKLVRSKKRKNNTRYRLKPGKLTYGAYDHRSDLSIEQVVGNLLRIKKPEDGSWVLQRERKPTEVEMRTGTKEGDGGEYETTYSCIYRIIMFPNGTYRILVNGIPGTPYAIHGQNNAIWGVIDN